jgi:hypothetical protein
VATERPRTRSLVNGVDTRRDVRLFGRVEGGVESLDDAVEREGDPYTPRSERERQQEDPRQEAELVQRQQHGASDSGWH